MALLEAMRVGTIAITSDFDNGCKEIIKDGYNGYVIPHKDLNGFVERIKDIILNPEKYTGIYVNSYKTYLSELSFAVWKKIWIFLLMDHVTNIKNGMKLLM